jgi:hypothetical protein
LSFCPTGGDPLSVWRWGRILCSPGDPDKEECMSQLTPEEEQKILDSSPVGTFALMLVFAALMLAGWGFMFFYMFLQHGPVN